MDRIVGGIFIGLSQIPVNLVILEKLVLLSFKREYVIKCINANKHNHATTSYYLLLKKAEKAGEIEDS
jgi:5'-AMP-activated protein kinase catalytic alpha subunit